jgi:hypothetical protein
MYRRFTQWIAWISLFLLACCSTHPAPKPATTTASVTPTTAPVAQTPVTQPTTQQFAIATTTITTTAPSPTDSDPKDIIPFLASDDLQGRGIGMPGLDRAADLIVSEFSADGLKPLPGSTDFFQPFDYTTQSTPGAATYLAIGARKLAIGTQYLPMRFSLEDKFVGQVVFAGYGVTAPEVGYDDYNGLDVRGKAVIAMRYEPTDAHGQSAITTQPDASGWSDHATFSAKAKNAADHGAVALLVVNPPDSQPDLLVPFRETAGASATIPVYQIHQSVADLILSVASAPTLKTLRDEIDSSFKPHSFAMSRPILSGEVQIDSQLTHLKNVAAVLPGQGPHADEYVVVGAHYDHLGLGQFGGMFGPVGSIYHGADDNASGTATILEVASRMAAGPPPDRSIIFICFTAEEEGLIGSEYFVKHPPVPLNKIVAMVNLDMVGRIRNQTLNIGGQGTAKDFDAVLAQADSDSPLKLKSIGRGGMGPSDHMSFALRRIPVLFFFSGIHADYHRPTDTADKVNYEGIDEVADFTQKVITGLTKMPRDPYIVDADKDSMHLFGVNMYGNVPTRRVILGVIPDYAAADSRVGVLISGTTPGTPAEAAGLREGDLLVQFGPTKLENLMDLTEALAHSKPGDRISLKILRGNQSLSFDITLAERKG